MKFFFSLVLAFLFLENKEANSCDIHELGLSGPGINPKLALPVQYFFINTTQPDGKRCTQTKPSLQITKNDDGNPLWFQMLDFQDGTFLVRYQVHLPCPKGISITISLNDQNTTIPISTPVIPESCYCPLPATEWSRSMHCPHKHAQIEVDFKPFPHIDMDAVMIQMLKHFNHPGSYSFCQYTLLDNQVYRKCYGQYVGFAMFMDNILLSLARKVKLPDVEFVVNLGDWPLSRKGSLKVPPLPILGWCGSEDTHDIVAPTYELTEATLGMMTRVSVDVLSVMGSTSIPWEEREPVAFWRGRDSNQERLKLVRLSRQHPDHLNASLTHFFFFREQEEELGPKVPAVPFFDFFKYRYQISVDGTVAAYRFPFLLAGGSLVLKQESRYYEHFYRDLKPNEHYVPVQANLSDLVEKIQWARQHDVKAHHIATMGRRFVLQHLLPETIFCYYLALLQEYEKRLKHPPKVAQGMELIKQPSDAPSCPCPQSQRHQLRQEL